MRHSSNKSIPLVLLHRYTRDRRQNQYPWSAGGQGDGGHAGAVRAGASVQHGRQMEGQARPPKSTWTRGATVQKIIPIFPPFV